MPSSWQSRPHRPLRRAAASSHRPLQRPPQRLLTSVCPHNSSPRQGFCSLHMPASQVQSLQRLQLHGCSAAASRLLGCRADGRLLCPTCHHPTGTVLWVRQRQCWPQVPHLGPGSRSRRRHEAALAAGSALRRGCRACRSVSPARCSAWASGALELAQMRSPMQQRKERTSSFQLCRPLRKAQRHSQIAHPAPPALQLQRQRHRQRSRRRLLHRWQRASETPRRHSTACCRCRTCALQMRTCMPAQSRSRLPALSPTVSRCHHPQHRQLICHMPERQPQSCCRPGLSRRQRSLRQSVWWPQRRREICRRWLRQSRRCSSCCGYVDSRWTLRHCPP